MSTDEGAGRRDEGPSRLWAILAGAGGTVLALAELTAVLAALPETGWQQSMIGVLLATSLLLGGYSLARVLQLAIYAGTRPTGSRRREPTFALTQAHTLHAIWLIGLGASIAFMGVLGVWSALDGRTSGLEPGWPLIVIGAVLAVVSAAASRLTTRWWARLQEETVPRDRADVDR